MNYTTNVEIKEKFSILQYVMLSSEGRYWLKKSQFSYMLNYQ